jgi:hypothetical protein
MVEAFVFPSSAQLMMAEFLARAEVTPESNSYLLKTRLSGRMPELEANCSILTVALAQFFDGQSGRIFRFHPDGEPAVIIGAHPALGEMPHDLIAWPLYGMDRDSFATYLQEAVLLGTPAVLQARNASAALRLHRLPEDWILSGFEGSVVLNRRWGGHWLSKLPGPFIAEDVEHGREVAGMLRPYGKAHLVRIPATEARQEAA